VSQFSKEEQQILIQHLLNVPPTICNDLYRRSNSS